MPLRQSIGDIFRHVVAIIVAHPIVSAISALLSFGILLLRPILAKPYPALMCLAISVSTAVVAFLISSLTFAKHLEGLRKDRVRFTEKIAGSPFEFIPLAREARKSIMVAGPNLNFIATSEEARDIIKNRLSEPGFIVRLILTNPKSDICSIWEDVGFTPGFQEELRKAIEILRDLRAETTRRRVPGQLVLIQAKVMLLPLTFIDFEDPSNARALVTPIPWGLAGTMRPAIMIRQSEHPLAFGTYYDNFQQLLRSTMVEPL